MLKSFKTEITKLARVLFLGGKVKYLTHIFSLPEYPDTPNFQNCNVPAILLQESIMHYETKLFTAAL